MQEDEATMSVRVPNALLKMARSVAASRDETLSQVVRRALKAYVDRAPRQLDLVDAVDASKRRRG